MVDKHFQTVPVVMMLFHFQYCLCVIDTFHYDEITKQVAVVQCHKDTMITITVWIANKITCTIFIVCYFPKRILSFPNILIQFWQCHKIISSFLISVYWNSITEQKKKTMKTDITLFYLTEIHSKANDSSDHRPSLKR